MTRPFHIVDVFAERPYAGNPLAVVLDADGLPEDAMRWIAAEPNYSETAFVTSTPERDGAFRVRLFTPAREIDFAGHPLLGSGWVVRHHLLPNASGHVCLRIAARGYLRLLRIVSRRSRGSLVSCTASVL